MMKRTMLVVCVALLSSVLATAQVPQASHVFVVMEENHSYSNVIGSSSMPYLNSLAKKYGLSTQYYGNTHPSIGNYFMFATGQIISNSDSFTGTVTADNIVRRFLVAGKTWKAYAEGLPYAGYLGGDTNGYLRHHNPFSFIEDVRNSSSERLNMVPMWKFKSDLQNHTLPRFSFLAPNSCNDAHDCSLTTADNWLKSNIAPLISSSTFQNGGLLVIVFDESSRSDTSHGGGHVAAVVIGPKVRSGHRSTSFYQHQSLLKLVLQAVGISSYPGAAKSAPGMGEFFF